jgi:DNA-binding MarR family transcriptional regulator
MKHRPFLLHDYRRLAQFRRALRLFLAFSAEAAAKAGLTPVQHQALLAIKGMPGPPSVGALAAWLGIRPHSALGLVERLVGRKLVKKISDSTDRRRVILALTRAAEAKLGALSLAHRGELKRLARTLGSG